ncbi:acyl-CoA thioesterase [Streptococcus rupicaprae]|uniref:Acyl-CoA thioesterase n=1 Tax=Streptococcus rupicaprae TaxID=759619 RepID=A0ABV2FHX8_9STRE
MKDLKLTTIVAFDNATIEEVGEGHVLVSTVVGQQSLNIYGHAHGGYLFTLCDEVSGLTAMTVGCDTVTIQSNINYLKAAKAGQKLWIQSQLVHNGRTTKVIEVVIKNDAGDLLVKGTFTMFVTGLRDSKEA